MSGESRAARAGRVLAASLPDAAAVIGAALLAYGVGQVYPPAAWVVAGVLLLAAGLTGVLRGGRG